MASVENLNSLYLHKIIEHLKEFIEEKEILKPCVPFLDVDSSHIS